VSPNGTSCTVPPDIDPILNATFGEQFGDSRVSDNLTWINAAISDVPESGAGLLSITGLLGLVVRSQCRRLDARQN